MDMLLSVIYVLLFSTASRASWTITPNGTGAADPLTLRDTSSGSILSNFCGVAQLSKPRKAIVSTCNGSFKRIVEHSRGEDKWGQFTRVTFLHTPTASSIVNVSVVLDVWLYKDAAHTRLTVTGQCESASNWMAPINAAGVSLKGLSQSPSTHVLLVPFDNDMYSVYESISSTGSGRSSKLTLVFDPNLLFVT
jgi:hypothetical protein